MKTLKPGVYGWAGKKLKRLQTFDTNYKLKRSNWMGKSLIRLSNNQQGFERTFEKELNRVIDKFNSGKV